MKRFKFRLKPVQRLKEALYEEAERKSIAQRMVFEQEQERLRELFLRKGVIRGQAAEFHRKLDFVMLDLVRRNEIGINQLITAQELRIEEARRQLIRLQEETTFALKEKRVFEKLEESARKKYQKEYLLDQQNKLDDFRAVNILNLGGGDGE
jgi:hypothetical protein